MTQPSPVTLTIPSDSKYLSLIRSLIRHLLAFYDVPEDIVQKLALCVDEACANIIKHSYEGSCSNTIDLTFEVDNDIFKVKIRDYGKQCDTRKFKSRALEEVKPGGLGTYFMREIMDTVEYCTNREKGTLLTMTKKLRQDATLFGVKQ